EKCGTALAFSCFPRCEGKDALDAGSHATDRAADCHRRPGRPDGPRLQRRYGPAGLRGAARGPDHPRRDPVGVPRRRGGAGGQDSSQGMSHRIGEADVLKKTPFRWGKLLTWAVMTLAGVGGVMAGLFLYLNRDAHGADPAQKLTHVEKAQLSRPDENSI